MNMENAGRKAPDLTQPKVHNEETSRDWSKDIGKRVRGFDRLSGKEAGGGPGGGARG